MASISKDFLTFSWSPWGDACMAFAPRLASCMLGIALSSALCLVSSNVASSMQKASWGIESVSTVVDVFYKGSAHCPTKIGETFYLKSQNCSSNLTTTYFVSLQLDSFLRYTVKHIDQTKMSLIHSCNDGGPCPIAPHPDLQARLLAENLRVQQHPDSAPSFDLLHEGSLPLSVPTGHVPGLNDGTIFPQSHYETPQPLSILRNAALERAPLRGTIRSVV
jgi:hypothetical protein